MECRQDELASMRRQADNKTEQIESILEQVAARTREFHQRCNPQPQEVQWSVAHLDRIARLQKDFDAFREATDRQMVTLFLEIRQLEDQLHEAELDAETVRAPVKHWLLANAR